MNAKLSAENHPFAHPLHLEVPEVERAFNLGILEDVLAEDRERGDVKDDTVPPSVRLLARRAPGPRQRPNRAR